MGSANPVVDDNPVTTFEWLYSKVEVGVIKIHPVHQLFRPNAYRKEEGGMTMLKKMYEFLDASKIPVMIHTGSSVFPGAGLKYGDPVLPCREDGVCLLAQDDQRALSETGTNARIAGIVGN